MDQALQARPPSLTEQAYELLRREIITCALVPGADVSESELAERLQMSKTPVWRRSRLVVGQSQPFGHRRIVFSAAAGPG